MQHHHVDEFSITDLRHTIHEAWRVLRARRWFLVFPFCIVSAVACLCSLLLPRQYTASTIIKREHDPVFANMMGRSWTQPYEDVRRRMETETAEPAFIAEVLEALDLPRGLKPYDDGTPTPVSDRTRAELVAQVASGLSTETIEESKHRDIVRISLTQGEPDHVRDILRTVRDRYVSKACVQTAEILESVERFLLTESDRCRAKLSEVQIRLVEFELRYPGINPDRPGTAGAEETALVIERVKAERQLEDAAFEQDRLRAELAKWIGPSGRMNETVQPVMVEKPNPRYAELSEEIAGLEREITDGKNVRLMTNAHPVIQRARELLVVRRAELARTPERLEAPAQVGDVRAAGRKAVDEVKAQLARAETRAAALKERSREVDARLDRIEDRRALALEHRQAYLKVHSQAERLETELAAWQKDIAPIQHVLHLEDLDRSIHFATVQDVTAIAKPSSPDSRFVLLICFGIGLAAAVVSVLLAELLDRSYRTAKQLTTSLGMPVIESIDQIMTQAALRRKLIRNMLVMPTLGVVAVTVMLLAGTMAYVSLESTGDFEWMRPSTIRLSALFEEQG